MTRTIVSSQYPEVPGYKIIRPLGKGGMAVVYVATQDAYLNREIALKILPMELAGDQSFVERFMLEAASIGKLEHPNITAVYEFGEHEGQLFLAMRLLQGGGLDQLQDKGAIGVDKAVEITRCIGKALGFAHSKGIVHRDVKPENILFDGEGNPMLADFGIAREVTGDSALTQGFVIGTVPYMSPEQMSGEIVDGTTDLYALGIVLYELLTQEKPYHGKPFADVLIEKLDSQPLKLPANLRRFQPLLDRLLAPKEADRFPDAASFITALDLIPVKGHSTDKPGGKRIAVLGGLCIAVAALGYAAYSSYFPDSDAIITIPATASDTASASRDEERPANLAIANAGVTQFHRYLDIVKTKDPASARAFVSSYPMSSLTVLAQLATASQQDASARIAQLITQAEAGDHGAALVLSEAYDEGWGVADADRNRARYWATQAALSGEPLAQFSLALLQLEDDADPTTGLATLNTLAESGYFLAENLLGTMLLQGNLGQSDPARGIDLLRKAADQNYRDALFNLAMAHANGNGVVQNLELSTELLQQAAQLGDQDAQNAIEASSP